MTRVMTFAGPADRQFMMGMGVVLLAILAAAALLVRLTATWSRHVSSRALAAHDIAELPALHARTAMVPALPWRANAQRKKDINGDYIKVTLIFRPA